MTFVTRLRRITFKPRHICAAVLGSFAIAAANAEDIDIFAANTSLEHRPNVLIIIDNSSNWSATLASSADCTAKGWPATKFGAEMCALTNTVKTLPTSMRIGLMMFTESGNNGAYVRFGIRDMTGDAYDPGPLTPNAGSGNKGALTRMMYNFVQQGSGTDNSGSNQPYAKAMFEAFKYFGGYTNQAEAATTDRPGSPISQTAFGNNAFAGGASNSAGTFRRDYDNNQPASNRAASSYGASAFDSNLKPDNAYVDKTSDTYNSPIKDSCAKNFIIFISNGNPSTGGDSSVNPARDTQILSNLSVTPTCLPNCTSETHASKMDEMAKFLFETDVSDRVGIQAVQTFTVAVWQPQANKLPSNSDQQMINLMQSAATYGGGKFCSATNADEVAKCIESVLNELQAVNSVFVSSSLPVSVNAQGTYLNQVYMGMFRPDRFSSPRWVGNLKEYKVDQDSLGNLFLADSVDTPAVNSVTGFISPNAKSFWSSASTFWTNNPMGTPATGSDLPDGEVVEKGGAAQQLRTAYAADQSTRRMFTCPTGGCSAGGVLNYAFDAANMTSQNLAATFGVGDNTALTRLVNWVRGQDNFNADPCPVGSASCANWTSAEKGPGWPTTVRPSAHGDVLHARPVVLNYASVGPYVFYGANDGVLRAIKGGRVAATDGKEAWSFIAPEFYPRYNRLRAGQPTLQLPTVLGSNTMKDYFFDGPIGAYQDATRAWIFVTARRGGRFIYAFDVSDPTNPKFMWKKSNADTNMSELGQTWSEPKAVKVKAYADPILIFGAGYDPNEDKTPAGAATMGRGVFVLNARTGDFIKLFNTSANSGGPQNSIPSDVAVIDRDFDTFADRAYVGDTGGNIWRMDIDDTSAANWKMEKLASLGPFKFLYRPDVIPTRNFDEVLAGTGDREKPLVTTSTDYFFMLKDIATGKDGSGLVPLGFGDLVLNGTAADPAKGWYLPLAAGEKVVNAPLTIGGITFFATNKPTPPPPDGDKSCVPNLGEARAYAVDFLTGGAGIDRNGDGTKNAGDLSVLLVGGGLPPSAVGGTLELDDGTTTPFCIGCGSTRKPPEAEKPPVTIPKVRKKLYWNAATDK